jgi:glycerol kinase
VPDWPAEHRDRGYRQWKKAVERTVGWVDVDAEPS